MMLRVMIIRDPGVDEVDEFRIELTADGDHTYFKFGDDDRQPFVNPFKRDEVEGVLSETSAVRLSVDPLMSLGSALFNALFAGERGRELWERLAESERRNRALRVRVVTSVERLQSLPWELLYDPSRRDFMPLSGRVTLVRTRNEGFVDKALPPAPRLRVLAVSAEGTATDAPLMRDLALLEELGDSSSGRLDVDFLREATPLMLIKRLQAQQYDVFHFSGTGEVLPYASKRGGLRQALRLLGTPTMDPLVNRHDLGKALEAAGVRLAVLNAPHTDWFARSLSRYVPAAIGFRESVQPDTCYTFGRALYRGLLPGAPLDLVVTAARQALDRELPGTGEWCRLIFYMQRPNGSFLLPSRMAASSPPPRSASRGLESARSAPAAGASSKEVARLSRLREIYEKNLSVLEQVGSVSEGSYQREWDALQEKIREVQEQLSLAERQNRP